MSPSSAVTLVKVSSHDVVSVSKSQNLLESLLYNYSKYQYISVQIAFFNSGKSLENYHLEKRFSTGVPRQIHKCVQIFSND